MILIYIDRNVTEGLNRVCVEDNSVLFRDLADLLHRFDRSDFVVGKHNGNQDGGGADCLLQFIDFDDTILIYV